MSTKKSIQERFFDKVEKTESCWIWKAAKMGPKLPYGKFAINRKPIGAHRYSYILHKGEIPDGLHIDHLCRNRLCVNPDHLEAVSARENLLRGEGPTAINANKKFCKNGHEFNSENTDYRINNTRRCRVCHNKRSSEWYTKRKKKPFRKMSNYCRRGIHEWNDENTLFVRGYRYCKICRNKKRRSHDATSGPDPEKSSQRS